MNIYTFEITRNGITEPEFTEIEAESLAGAFLKAVVKSEYRDAICYEIVGERESVDASPASKEKLKPTKWPTLKEHIANMDEYDDGRFDLDHYKKGLKKEEKPKNLTFCTGHGYSVGDWVGLQLSHKSWFKKLLAWLRIIKPYRLEKYKVTNVQSNRFEIEEDHD